MAHLANHEAESKRGVSPAKARKQPVELPAAPTFTDDDAQMEAALTQY